MAYSALLLNFDIWVGTDVYIQTQLAALLVSYVSREPAVFRSLFGVQYFLDIVRNYYWTNAEEVFFAEFLSLDELELYESVFLCTSSCCGCAETVFVHAALPQRKYIFAALPHENTNLPLCRKIKQTEERCILIQPHLEILENSH